MSDENVVDLSQLGKSRVTVAPSDVLRHVKVMAIDWRLLGTFLGALNGTYRITTIGWPDGAAILGAQALAEGIQVLVYHPNFPYHLDGTPFTPLKVTWQFEPLDAPAAEPDESGPGDTLGLSARAEVRPQHA